MPKTKILATGGASHNKDILQVCVVVALYLFLVLHLGAGCLSLSLSPLFGGNKLSLNLELTDLTRMAAQQAPGID